MNKIIDQQLNKNDCGISVIKTICNIHNFNISRNYISKKIFLDERGANISEIKGFFEELGFLLDYKLLDLNYINENLTYFDNLFPFVIPVERKDELHYLVVNGIKKNKLIVYDSSIFQTKYLSIQEIKRQAHFTNSYYKLVDIEEKFRVIIEKDLDNYKISIKNIYKYNDLATAFNKISYFSYVKENYGFKSFLSEKSFLKDLLFNQELSNIPKQFKNLKLKKDLIQIKAPLILSVKKNENTNENINVSKGNEQNIYIKLLKSLGNNKRLWYIYIFSALFAAATTQLTVFINQILIDNVLPSFQMNILIVFAIGVGLFKLFDLIINQYKNFVGIHLGNLLDKYFLSVFDTKLNDFSIAYTQSYRRGDLTERLSDSLRLKRFFVQFFTRILVDSSVAIYSLAILFLINWKLSLIVSIVLVLFYFWFRIITPYLKSNERVRFQKKADLFSKMIEKIDGLQVIKSFKLENLISDKIIDSIDNLIKIQTKVRYINLLNTTVVSLITLTASLLIIIFLAKESILNQSISLGQIITFILLSSRVFSSLSKLLKENLSLQEHEVILRRFFDFNDPNNNKLSKNGITDFEIFEISLKNIEFGYNPKKIIITKLNLHIIKNDKIRIFGKNGSGKTTLSKILSMLYPPLNGVTEVNNTLSTFYNPNKLKEKILLVSNEDILFNETIEFNITLGQKTSTRKIIELSKQIDFYELISQTEGGLDFLISEAGKNLSTGQRKKILILRALLSKAEIMILDEVLSGLDSDARIKIEKVLNTIEKTLIIISHEDVHNIKFNKEFIIKNGELTKL
jgi:subfamily B ATP-binding cassette protein HlyB/CyaB